MHDQFIFDLLTAGSAYLSFWVCRLKLQQLPAPKVCAVDLASVATNSASANLSVMP